MDDTTPESEWKEWRENSIVLEFSEYEFACVLAAITEARDAQMRNLAKIGGQDFVDRSRSISALSAVLNRAMIQREQERIRRLAGREK